MITFSNFSSFFFEVTVATFELGFGAVVTQVYPHSFVALYTLYSTVEDAIKRRSLMVCEMGCCIKIFESPVAERFLAIKLTSFQVVIHSSGDVCAIEFLTTRRARRISRKPVFKTNLAKKF